jgi:four helix bundle protein
VNALFDHERLDVYRLELEFVSWAAALMNEAKVLDGVRTADVCDHLDRASLSALFNTAEGNGKRQRQIRAKFSDDARGSVSECAAALDALVAKGAFNEARVRTGKEMLVREFSMLTKLVQRYTNDGEVREDEETYLAGDDANEEDG